MATLVLVVTAGLRCHEPAKGGLFDPVAGSMDTASAGASGASAALPSMGGIETQVPGAGTSGSSAEAPPLLGFGGSTVVVAPSTGAGGAMGLAGAAGSTNVGGGSAVVDAGVLPAADCVLGEFREPEPLTGLEQGLNPNLDLNLWSPSLTMDGRSLFFAVEASGVDEQIATAARSARESAFSPAAAVATINSEGEDGSPLVSADGLSLYFYSTRAGGVGGRDLWSSTRAAVTVEFGTPTLVAGVNGPGVDHLPWVSPDELTMLWTTDRSGGVGQSDIWIARRNFRSDGFSNIAPLNGVNGTSNEGRAVLGKDELTIYFASDRPGGAGSLDLWSATRGERTSTFAEVTNLVGVNSPGLDSDPFLSADERELIFASDRDGGIRLWRSIRDCE